jgi:glycosyltransferase involved in cell wall biosynthesis
VDAMVMRKIVLASDVNAIKDLIRYGDNGFLFHKNNLEDLKRVLY